MDNPPSFSSKLRARLLGEGYLEPAPPAAPAAPKVNAEAASLRPKLGQAPLFQRYDLIALGLGILAFLAAARYLEYRQGKNAG